MKLKRNIQFVITGARIVESNGGWTVRHPSNDAILAYCGSQEDAIEAVKMLDALLNVLKGLD